MESRCPVVRSSIAPVARACIGTYMGSQRRRRARGVSWRSKPNPNPNPRSSQSEAPSAREHPRVTATSSSERVVRGWTRDSALTRLAWTSHLNEAPPPLNLMSTQLPAAKKRPKKTGGTQPHHRLDIYPQSHRRSSPPAGRRALSLVLVFLFA